MGALKNRRGWVQQAGDLLPVEAIDASGLAVTSEGAFVRVLAVTPPNPLILSAEERARIARGYCHLASWLRADQRLQFYVHSKPVNLKDVLAAAREEVSHTSGEPPVSLDGDGRGSLGLSRWRLYAAMEQSLRLHADEQAAVETSFYVVCPHVPVKRGGRDLLRELRPRHSGLLSGPLSRGLGAHRRAARESLAFTETVRAELEALAIPCRLINGEEFAGLLWARFNPTQADLSGRSPRMTEIVGDLDTAVDRQEAVRVARRLRGVIARSPMDFRRSYHHVEIDHDVEQTIWVATTAEHTHMGWLMGAMMNRQPFTLSVHVRALDRRRERTRLKMRYRRVFAVNRGAEARGRVPDFDRYAQEQETSHLLRDMAGSDRANLFELGIYLSVRAPGPDPDLAALVEAVDFCAEALTSTSDAAVNRGAHHQRRLWPSTLPLGRDAACYTRVYATQNIGDCVPLVGTGCGSPLGVPFAFAYPGRTLERLDPTDRVHDNQTLLVAGKSGSGKTMLVLTLLARLIALGVGPAFVIDRAGHFRTLTTLVHGARHLNIGSEDSQWAINHWDTPDQAAVPREKVAFLIALHAAMMGEEGLSVLERSQLAGAIRQVYADAHERGVRARESMLQTVLLERAAQEAKEGMAEVGAALRNLAERLGEFCGQGAYSYLLDRETNIPGDSPLVVFNTEHCPEAILGPVMLAIVEYVSGQVKRHHQEHGHLAGAPGVPLLRLVSVLLVDEAWHKLASPEAGVYLADLARRARHLGLFLTIITQALSDLNTKHGLPLLVNHAIVLLLKQRNATELTFSRETLGLTEEEQAIVGGLETVDGRYSEVFLMNGARGRGRVRFPVGPTEYWAFTNEPFRDIPAREVTIAKHNGDVWAAICELASQGVPAAHDHGRPA
jgi:TraG P-loop domain